MGDLIKKVKDCISRHQLLRKPGTVIVAVSGGADSVALLSALTELGYDCVAAHCNFHLRGDESNRDMRHVELIAKKLGVNLYVKEFDVYGRIKQTGESVEMACRALRYDWFFDLLDRDSAQAIAVGHHKEDQAETFFLNLLRGSGLTGLGGMRYRSEHVVRPFLDLSRIEIETYLHEKGLTWVNDSSNASDDFARNRLRNKILPQLEASFPGAGDAILRTMSYLRESEGLYLSAVSERAKQYMDADSGDIDLARMLSDEPFAPIILFETLKKEGFNRTQTNDMCTAALKSGGTFRCGATHVRDVDHGMVRAPRACAPVSPDTYDVVITRDIFSPIRIEVTHHHISEFQHQNKDINTAYIDATATEGWHTWQIRRWRRGDRIKPYGMNGSKLVSDIFSSAKLTARQKEEMWVLTRDDEIVWVVGLRASSLFTVGPSTRSFIKLFFVR